ncbi:MAG: hypothetical protein Q8880_12190, partial [Bacteroidota bacterium]|nr:hypothetical protein [Bacteroidota bacterium]
FEDNWYKCNDCLKVFIMNDSNSKQCLFCKSDNIVNIYNTEKMNKEKNEGFGPGGYCICVKCNTKISHATGKPCRLEKCPNCGASMLRENSYHHNLFKQKSKNDKSEM